MNVSSFFNLLIVPYWSILILTFSYFWFVLDMEQVKKVTHECESVSQEKSALQASLHELEVWMHITFLNFSS